MGLTRRKEYHWIDDRVVPRVADRPSGFGIWPGLHARRSTLVVAVEEPEDGISIVEEGPAATAARVREAVAMHVGMWGLEQSRDVGQHVPRTVLETIQKKVS